MKIFSHSHPRENILNYRPWHIQVDGAWTTLEILKGRKQGKTIVAQLKGVENREIARHYIGTELYIERAQLPKLAVGEYYWDELIGLQVINKRGIILGEILNMVDTGSNNVMIIGAKNPQKGNQKEHWVPYLEPFLISVAMDKRQVLVDWDENF